MMEYYTVAKKERILTFCDSMDGVGDYYAKWNKPVSERQISYDLTYNWNLMNKINEQMNKIELEAQKHGIDWQLLRGEGRGGDWLKEDEGIRQRTYMHDP